MAVEVQVVNGVPTPVILDAKTDGEEVTINQPAPEIWQDMDEALESLQDAMPGYEEAQKYYEGTVEEKFLNKAIEKLLSGSPTDFNVNLAGRVVDAVLDRMEIAAVTAEPVDNDDEAEEPEEDPEANSPEEGVEETDPEMSEEEKALDEAISKIWRRNEMDIEAPEVHQKMLSFGDSYLFVGLNDEEPDSVDLFYNSPLNVRVLYQDENPRKKRLVIKRWTIGSKNNKRIRLNLYYPTGTYKFISKGPTDGEGAASYQVYTDDSTDEMGYLVNESGELPFFHFRTARPYGRPEHKKAYGAQDALTKIIANMMSTVDFAGFPQRWALKDQGTTTDDDLDWESGNEDETANPDNLQSQLISGPGRVWALRNVKAVGQFQAAEMDQFLKPLNTFTGLMAAVTATPVSYFLVSIGATATPISGESQRKGESPFLSKVNARQLAAESSWSDALGYGMKLQGYDAEVKVRWAPAQVVSGVDGWKAVQEQQKAGVPVRQTLLEAGYSEAEVTSWGYTEDNPDGPGIDLSDQAFPPPVPGQAMPGNLTQQPVGTPVPEVAPTPPATPAAQEA